MYNLGRGTATRDGQAIACSVINRIITAQNPRCIFATHYHSLPEMVEQQSRIMLNKIYHMDCQVVEGKPLGYSVYV